MQQLVGTVGSSEHHPRVENILSLVDEEDDEEDEETILARLPGDTTLLREYITASQGFLLLLTLRQHLKDLYGFSDAKIGQYSPSEAAKVYEKAVNRKNNLLFKPKATLQRLKEGVSTVELDSDGRKKLVKEYLDFKQLMLKYDPEEPDEGEDGEQAGGGGKQSNTDNNQPPRIPNPELGPDNKLHDGAVTSNSLVNAQYHQTTTPMSMNSSFEHSNNSMNSTMPSSTPTSPRVPKLTIHPMNPDMKEHRKHRAHKTEKMRKHKKKKRRRISDSSESGEDYSDPDFLV